MPHAQIYSALGMLRHLDALMEQLLAQNKALEHWSTFFAWCEKNFLPFCTH